MTSCYECAGALTAIPSHFQWQCVECGRIWDAADLMLHPPPSSGAKNLEVLPVAEQTEKKP